MDISEIPRSHLRFLTQAKWTQEIRSHLLSIVNPSQLNRILEVGSGTGVISKEIQNLTHAEGFGVDINHRYNLTAKEFAKNLDFVTADGFALPFARDAFELTFCHFLLIWVKNPAAILREMKRVTSCGGWIIAFAEPDYAGRIDYPETLSQLGINQEASLQKTGADTRIGRKLRKLFTELNLTSVRVGVLGGEWDSGTEDGTIQSERQTLIADLSSTVDKEELKALLQLDAASWERGDRILFVPTFYAAGEVEK